MINNNVCGGDIMNNNGNMLSTLDKLINNWENEVVEFKEANKDYDKDKIGRYFSAISNEANLKNMQYGWLVFGVRDKDRVIVGTNYRIKGNGLEKLKDEIAKNTTGGITFLDIFELYVTTKDEEKRVIMMQIPAAVAGIPTGWNNHYYGRNGESLSALTMEEMERIRGQENRDWSKKIVVGATIDHLNKDAIKLARDNYKEKMHKPFISEEVDAMTDLEFLEKMKLIQNGKITNAAMLLLGNEDYDYLFDYAPEAAWRVYGSDDEIKDYEIFKIPFITLSDRIFLKIRNLTYRYMPDDSTLFPVETKQYDSWLLRELMNNCIAHSDYTKHGRIYLNEKEDELTFKNPGSFLPGSIETALSINYNPPFYRNQLLAEAMVKFNMIDTQSMGIRRVYKIQQEKYFPLPDYDLTQRDSVSVTVFGKVLDEKYTKLLFSNPNYDLHTVFLIDQVQKHRKISTQDKRYLRKLGVIEGERNNIYISYGLSKKLDSKAKYIKSKAFDNSYYEKLIIEYLIKYDSATINELRDLLYSKLSDNLSDNQKDNKIRGLLNGLSKQGKIQVVNPRTKKASWKLIKKMQNDLQN